ncbi:MAG: DnaA regulatory inactivator Hda [Betaproteobacteria bacterium]
MEQLVFELAAPEPPRLANFLPGRNAELLAALADFSGPASPDTGMLLWGAPASGKTHLLVATVAYAEVAGATARYFAAAHEVDDGVTAAPGALVAVDRIDEADAAAAGRLFTLFNALKVAGGRLICAARVPPAQLALREDLRTRLGWGLVYEVLPLSDEEKTAALAAHARERGFELHADVIDYLLRHGRRDLRSLLATLAALDRRSLATKRAISVAMVRDWLQQEREWDRRLGA